MKIVTRYLFLMIAAFVLLTSASHAATISISPAGQLNFTAANGDTATQSVTVTNLSALPLYITTNIVGSNSTNFGTSLMNPVQLMGYGSQTIRVSFMPTTTTGYDSAMLRVVSTLGDTLLSTLVGQAVNSSFQVTPQGTIVLNAQTGTTATDTLRLRNLGSSALILTPSLSGSNLSLFSVSSNSVSLMGDSTSALVVRFTPLVAGTDTAYLTLRSMSGDTTRITLIGVATSLSKFSFTPNGNIVFNTRVGVADTENVTIHNATGAALMLTPTLTGSGNFSVGMPSVTVGANGSTSVPIVFESNSAGTYNGMLSLRSLTGDTGSINLIGHAMLPNSFEIVAPQEVDFSSRVGQTECLPIRIMNNTASSVTISQLALTGDMTDFHFSNTGNLQLAANSGDSVMVCFTPTGTNNNFHAKLSFQYAGVTDSTVRGYVNIQLEGNTIGVPPNEGDSLFFLTTRSIDFDNVLVGSTQCQAIRVSNPTVAEVTIDSAYIVGMNHSQFTVSGATMDSIGSGSTNYIDVCFAPTVAMNDTTLTLNLVTTSALGTSTIPVTIFASAIDSTNGNGELTNCIYVRHEHGVLGPIIQGGTDTSAIYLTNRTNSAVTINSATVSGSGSSAFSVTSGFPLTIQSGAQGQLMVAFNPMSSGLPSFGATITLNATGSGLTCGPITIHVEGVAVPGRLGKGDHDTSDIDLGSQLTGNGTSIITITNPNFRTQACMNDTVTLTNTTSGTIKISNLLIPSNPNLMLVGNMNLPITLSSDQSVNAVVQFCGMGTAGQMFQAPLYVSTNQSIQPQVYTIQAIDPPAAAVAENNPVAINFAVLPNPSAGEVFFNIPGAATAHVEIYDVLGNLIARVQGTTQFQWNGMNASDSPVATGQYIVRVTGTDTQGQPYRASRELVIQH